jgi:arylsulfatase A-like enzyme
LFDQGWFTNSTMVRTSLSSLLIVLACGTLSAAPQALHVTHARLTSATAGDFSDGAILKALIDDSANGGAMWDRFLAGAVSIGLDDAGVFHVRVPITACRTMGSGLRCRSGASRINLKRTATPFVYRLHASLRQLNGAGTGTAQPEFPVRITILVNGGSDLIDVISDCAGLSPRGLGCRDRNRPNIIYLVSDDQRWDTLSYMPHTLALLADHGVRFTNAFVTSPLCAPSRASMLTGQYARHHGVQWLGLPNGGALKFVGPDQSTLATWLHAAGYRTGMYGKYLTDYSKQCPPYATTCYIPPGWDEWHVFLLQHYYNYALAENDRINTYGAAPTDYSTDVLASKAVEFITSSQGQPFFLHLGFHSPHQDGAEAPIPAPRHLGRFAGEPPWRPPSYDEDNISDKPPWLGLQPRENTILSGFLTNGAWGDAIRQAQLESLLAIDEAIKALVDALEATGQADNTIFVFTSDNGHFWGEHRFFYGKSFAYEESIRVPLIIRYPRLISASRVDDHQVLNIDLPPTLAALAGVAVPASVDGADLSPLLTNAAAPWRSDFILELWNNTGPDELPPYVAVRNDTWKYVEYPSAPVPELYDLVGDPFELENRANDPAYRDVVETMQGRLNALLND